MQPDEQEGRIVDRGIQPIRTANPEGNGSETGAVVSGGRWEL